ncbi:eukaryotic translation initiation factor 2A [Lepeophtheirus salmonis]|uniref:Eukaryotic translation initiation factor 2A n=1 Tax=Lepeophtheirus salmonis TaxID=72036 RepID=A0A0K2TNW5_LEPSM|nr:eukaryotic translation initiation factor 2A-like [Lepeophtheirus salmonis]
MMWSGNSLAVRDAKGLVLLEGLPEDEPKPCDSFPSQSGSSTRVLATSMDGSKLAWAEGTAVFLTEYDGSSWSKPHSFPHQRAARLVFSPKGSILTSYETYAIRNNQVPSANVYLWDTKTKSETPLASYVSQGTDSWCIQWSSDESLALRKLPNSQILVFDTSDYSKKSSPKFDTKFDYLSLSPKGNNFVIFQKGGQKKESVASFAKFFTYPNLSSPVGNKSLAFADKMDSFWSASGNAVLLLSTAEVDSSSYYGKQQLYFMNSSGDSVNMRTPKEGPIYCVTWSPTKDEFIVVYGFMPAKVTLYDKSCNKIFDFGTGPRNAVHFNPQGTIALFGGFGNINGAIEVWDIREKEKLASFEAPYTTDLKWSPDGKLFVTSTCAPRLRIGNGYKIWHYSGSLLYEKNYGNEEELWEVCWKNPLKPYPVFPISKVPVKGIKSSTPVTSKQAYRPPMARNRGGSQMTAPLGEKELPENEKGKGNEEKGGVNKSAAKNLKRREAAKKKKETISLNGGTTDSNADSTVTEQKGGDPSQNYKKIRKLQDKLAQISQLKVLQSEGKKLETNQLEKLKKEKEFLEEIAKLQL